MKIPFVMTHEKMKCRQGLLQLWIGYGEERKNEEDGEFISVQGRWGVYYSKGRRRSSIHKMKVNSDHTKIVVKKLVFLYGFPIWCDFG